jgi:NMD protein affecting ribosome stability and mRNA decay
LTDPAGLLDARAMAVCKSCGDEVDELVSVTVDGKTKKLCESCAEEAQQNDAIAEESEAAVQNMMGFKGRR